MTRMDRSDSYEERFAAEHRRLDAMFEALIAALRGGAGDTRAAHASFAALRDAFESHIAQEDRLYYPAVRALRPAHATAIAGLVEAHEAFRGRLAAIDADFPHAAASTLEPALASFVTAFAAHEVAEERLLRALDDELRRAAGAGAPPTPAT